MLLEPDHRIHFLSKRTAVSSFNVKSVSPSSEDISLFLKLICAEDSLLAKIDFPSEHHQLQAP